MLQIPISDEMAKKLRQVARARGARVAELVEQALQEYLTHQAENPEPASAPTDDTWVEQITREQKAFEAQHAALLERYRGQTIAMFDGQVIDHDGDEEALWRRVHARLGNQPVLVTPVLAESRQVIQVRGPRIQN